MDFGEKYKKYEIRNLKKYSHFIGYVNEYFICSS